MSTSDREILLQAEGLGPGRGAGTLNEKTRSVWFSRDLKGLKSFAPLLEAPNLESIVIKVDHKIPTFDSITGLKQLKQLILRGNLTIASLAALEQFPQLEELEVGKIFPLLDGLRLTPHTVRVEATGVKDVAFLARFPNLRHLDLGSDMVYTQLDDDADFTPVAGLRSLYILSRTLTRLDRLSVLKELRSLWTPANKKLKSIAGVEQLPLLEAFACYRCSVSDIAPLRGLPLRVLVMGENRIRSLKQIDNQQLIQLQARKLPLKAFDVQTDLPQLELLDLGSTELTRLDELAHLGTLKHLDLTGVAAVTDFSPLYGLERLEHLGLGETQLTAPQLERLLDLPHLKTLDIYRTPAADSPHSELLKEQAQQRGIELCTASLTWANALYRHDKRSLDYLMKAFLGADNPLAHLSDKGYDV